MMTKRIRKPWTITAVLACLAGLAVPVAAQNSGADNSDTQSAKTNSSGASSEIEQLKKMLLDQQHQIDQLRRELSAQKGASEKPEQKAEEAKPEQKASDPAAALAAPIHPGIATHDVGSSLGEVASTTPAIPPAPSPVTPPAAIAAAPAPQIGESSPLQLKIGDAYITPVGFMDMMLVSRSTNPGSGIGTNFGSIPYGNTQQGALTETRLSIQNSRIGARFDALYHDWKILGYWESDFLGQLGNPPNGGLAVSSNPFVFRMRLYWVDLTKGKFEFLAGQSWSLATPNRRGISPLPGDIFYSNDLDVNYQLGLVWSRVGGYRFGFHPSDKVVLGFALENSEPYIGGGNGGSAAVLPAAFSSQSGTEINGGNSVISAPALMPDMIAKLAFDPSSRLHFELVGIGVADKIANPSGVAGLTPFATHSAFGGGGEANLNVELVPHLRYILNTFWSDGAGRYVFGQAPDFIVRSNGNISLAHSASGVTGFEATAGKTVFFAYYGQVYIPKDLALDANGTTKIGYGPISSDGQNRSIWEFTVGSNTTLMKDPKWGALNLMWQFSYEQRDPWLAAAGAPSNAHVAMGFFDIRYTLPGSAPTLGK
jgi:hypothetical protein